MKYLFEINRMINVLKQSIHAAVFFHLKKKSLIQSVRAKETHSYSYLLIFIRCRDNATQKNAFILSFDKIYCLLERKKNAIQHTDFAFINIISEAFKIL